MARRRGGKTIDSVRWAQMTADTNLSAGTVGVQLLSQILGIRSTVLRVRANVEASIEGVQAGGARVRVGMGLIIRPEGTGTTVLQSPLTDPNADWFWYESFVLGYEEMVTDVVDVPGLSNFRSVVDNKSMRRWQGDEEIQLVVENLTLSSASSVRVSLSGRILLGS